MRVVGIHGVAQHRFPADELTRAWSAALRDGLAAAGHPSTVEVDFSLVYYADLLEERRQEWKGLTDDAPIDPGTEPEVVELVLTWFAAFDSDSAGPDKGAVGVPATPMLVQRAVHGLASSPGLQDLGQAGVRRLARHMHAYLAYPQAREALWKLVSAVVDSAPEPIVLVGHSMGSVIAYEWIRQTSRSTRLVTLGSPLGCVPVRSRLGHEPSFPRTCTRWVNVAGRYDPIAWPKKLAPIFGTAVEDRTMEPNEDPASGGHQSWLAGRVRRC